MTTSSTHNLIGWPLSKYEVRVTPHHEGRSHELTCTSRFGQQLKQSLIKEYYWHYIAYDELKTALKTPFVNGRDGARKPWSEDDEKAFVQQLESELDKVYTFQKLKAQEIVSRIKASEKEVKQVLERQDRQNTGEDSTDDGLEEDFLLLEADLSDIIADVHDLSKYTQLNYTGFQKIIKKHDKMTEWQLRPSFATRLKAKPFFQDNYDAFIVKLSKQYDLVRTRGNPVKGDSAAGGGQQNFVRQTTKYWVHADNITELKLIILKHLPVLVFNSNKEFEERDTAISSIYYDNPDTWELYMGRLKKTEGAEAIRLRWYGGMENETIFIERKTHREDWTGEKSVKARFTLKEKNVNDFMAGKMTVKDAFAKMRKDGKKGIKEIEELEQLAREVQYRVVTRRLVPVTRSFYHRTAFQLPGDARVRISLDTELTMTREDNLDGVQRCGKNWRRMDIGIDWPFSQLPKGDVELFPYAVLEVKLQTQAGQEPPQWIRDLTASHLVEAVPKFSKFIHGTVTMFPDRIRLLPFWIPQMDVDIRKPITHNFGIERPGSYSTSPLDSDDEFDSGDEADYDDDKPAGDHPDRPYRDHDENGDEDEDHHANGRTPHDSHSAPANALDIEERIAAHRLLEDEDYPLYDSASEDEADALDTARQQGHGLRYQYLLLKKNLSHLFSFTTTTQLPTNPGTTSGTMTQMPNRALYSSKKFKAPKGKRIHVPVRVEPKVYFANERTFLSWLEFSIILGSIAAALLNFGDAVSVGAGTGFTLVAAAALLYSVIMYYLRVQLVRKRRATVALYYDKWGTTGLCVGLLVATGVNFVRKIGEEGWGVDK